MELIAVVLGAENSQDRFQACKQMLDYGFANYALVAPELPAATAVPVKLGYSAAVTAAPAAVAADLK
jgi:D-alanyl-D-alanine carboxypeptidase (penicillin-binding protein 5/6)